jgi:hypothetical protein
LVRLNSTGAFDQPPHPSAMARQPDEAGRPSNPEDPHLPGAAVSSPQVVGHLTGPAPSSPVVGPAESSSAQRTPAGSLDRRTPSSSIDSTAQFMPGRIHKDSTDSASSMPPASPPLHAERRSSSMDGTSWWTGTPQSGRHSPAPAIAGNAAFSLAVARMKAAAKARAASTGSDGTGGRSGASTPGGAPAGPAEAPTPVAAKGRLLMASRKIVAMKRMGIDPTAPASAVQRMIGRWSKRQLLAEESAVDRPTVPSRSRSGPRTASMTAGTTQPSTQQ